MLQQGTRTVEDVRSTGAGTPQAKAEAVARLVDVDGTRPLDADGGGDAARQYGNRGQRCGQGIFVADTVLDAEQRRRRCAGGIQRSTQLADRGRRVVALDRKDGQVKGGFRAGQRLLWARDRTHVAHGVAAGLVRQDQPTAAYGLDKGGPAGERHLLVGTGQLAADEAADGARADDQNIHFATRRSRS